MCMNGFFSTKGTYDWIEIYLIHQAEGNEGNLRMSILDNSERNLTI